jgi:hypothetical protein
VPSRRRSRLSTDPPASAWRRIAPVRCSFSDPACAISLRRSWPSLAYVRVVGYLGVDGPLPDELGGPPIGNRLRPAAVAMSTSPPVSSSFCRQWASSMRHTLQRH